MTEDRDALLRLERTVGELRASLSRLEARVTALEGTPTRTRAEPVDLGDEPPPDLLPQVARSGQANLLGVLGRLFLVLGGAFLIRSITDSGSLPRASGVALGVVYGLLWAWVADRHGRRGKPLEATAFLLASAAIVFPLTLETTLKLQVLSPPVAALLLLVVTVALVAVTWRQDLHVTTWLVLLASLGTGLVLMAATASLRTFAVLFLVLGGGSLWLTYGRRWHGLRWPVAMAANLSILLMNLLTAWPGGPPEAYKTLTPASAILLSLALVLVYLGSFVGRTLQRNRTVIPFEILQTIAVLTIGFGGAVRVAQVSGSGSALLGAAALPVGLACYFVAFLFVERQAEAGSNFRFYSTLALVFVLGGCLIALPPERLAASVLALGLILAGLGARYRHATLLSHSGLFLVTGVVGSGLLARSVGAFVSVGGLPSLHFTAQDMGIVGVLVVAHGVMKLRDLGPLPWYQRSGAFLSAALAVVALGAFAVVAVGPRLLGPTPEAGDLAALRTATLSLLVILAALLARRMPGSELRGLVYPLLALIGFKILVEDLGRGRPLTLSLAFTCFGAALTLAPILLKRAGGNADTPPS